MRRRRCGATVVAVNNHEGEAIMGDEDKVDNKLDELKGRAKELEGEVTGDEAREAQGKGEQSKANLKQAAEKVKDAFKH
jgi:uncharacterized protein YjbJ (UPF0337 family)